MPLPFYIFPFLSRNPEISSIKISFSYDCSFYSYCFQLTIEAFAPFNTTGLTDPISEDSVSVCGVSLIDMGDNYKFFDTSVVSNAKLASENGMTSIQDSLSLGKILNAGSGKR